MEIPVFSPTPYQLVENFIHKNPGCTVRAIINGLDMSENTVWTCVNRLRRAGRVRRLVIENERRMCLEIGAEPPSADKPDNPRDGMPDQRTVSTWEKDDIAQQSWLSSLMRQETNDL